MAQTAPTPPAADAPRPLPRRAAGAAKAPRPPRLVPLDGAWMVLLALVSVVVSAQASDFNADRAWLSGACLAAVTTALLYLLGWRARDRATGVIAGLLLATSLPFALHAAAAPRDAWLALLTVASLLSFVAGSSLLALTLAGLAAVARPDALLLGAVLAGLALAQGRRRAVAGAALFVCLAGLGWVLLTGLTHQHFPTLHFEARGGLVTWAVAPGMAFVTWMLLPFCAEWGEAPRRARWLPVVLWTLVYFVASCFVRLGDFGTTLFPLLPLWFVLAGAGLSRLLPALIGEIPLPWARYLLATAAVVSVLAMRFRAEEPLLHPAPTPAVITRPVPPVTPPTHPVVLPLPVPIIHQAAPPIVPHPSQAPVPKPTPKPTPQAVTKPAAPKPAALKPAVTKPAVPKPAVTKPAVKPKATVVKAAPAKPNERVVPLYIHRNGRLVRRSQWAIAWDRAHPGGH